MVKVDLSRIVKSFQLICISTTWLHSLYHTVILRARFKKKKERHDQMQLVNGPRAHWAWSRQPFQVGFIFCASGCRSRLLHQLLMPSVRGGREDSGFWDLLCRGHVLVISISFKQAQLQQLKKASLASRSCLLLARETHKKALLIVTANLIVLPF